MGNSVSFANNPANFQAFLERINAEPQAFDDSFHYKHVLHLWEFLPDEADELIVTNKPIKISEFYELSNEKCYLILHTFIRKLRPNERGTNIIEVIDDKKENNENPKKERFITSIFESTRESITPRGQSSASFGYHTANPTKLKGKLQYDIHIWNGKNARSLVRAVAFSSIISLDAQIKKAECLTPLLTFHTESPNTYSLSSVYHHLPINSTWRKLTSFNNLFSILIKDFLLLNGSRDDMPVRSFHLGDPSRSNPVLSVKSDNIKKKKKKTKGGDEKITRQERTKEFQSEKSNSSSKQNFRSISLPSKQLNLVKTGMRLDLGKKPNLFLDVSDLPDSVKDDLRPPSQERIKRYDKICSKISDDLYLGSDTIARDLQELKKAGITHILNCAGAVCSEYHPDSFVYKTLFLSDGKTEDIACIFYDVLEYIENSIEKGGKVFVHCHQGISRSSSMVILFLMWKNKTTFAETHESVKRLREIANPNAGFISQLMTWWNSLSKPILSPRLYQIVPHSVNTPSLFMMKIVSSLDSRGCFLLHDTDTIYLWKGKDSFPLLEEWSRKYIQRIQKYEKATTLVKLEEQGKESAAFRFIMGASLDNVQPKPEYDQYYSILKASTEKKLIKGFSFDKSPLSLRKKKKRSDSNSNNNNNNNNNNNSEL